MYYTTIIIHLGKNCQIALNFTSHPSPDKMSQMENAQSNVLILKGKKDEK